MDILAHGLWSNILVYKKYPRNYKPRLIAVLFGVLPDIIPFVPSTIFLLFSRAQFDFYTALYSQDWIFVWGREAYNYTHSFVVFIAATLIVMVFSKGKVYPHTKLMQVNPQSSRENVLRYKKFKLWLGEFGVGVYWPILAWGLHILMDLFTHPNFFRTPFLFPLSNYRIPFGLSWGHPLIMIPQYAFFAAWYCWWFLKKRKM